MAWKKLNKGYLFILFLFDFVFVFVWPKLTGALADNPWPHNTVLRLHF